MFSFHLFQPEQPQTSDLPQQLWKTLFCDAHVTQKKATERKEKKPLNYMLCKEEVKQEKIYKKKYIFVHPLGSCMKGMHCRAIPRGIEKRHFSLCLPR